MAGDRKGDIRRRAASVFADQGFDRASIRDVAKASEMSLAGLYHYYRSKDEILFDIQHEAFRTLLESHAEALAGVSDPAEKLERIIDGHLVFFAENISEMKVMSRESEQLQDSFGEEVGELRRRYVRLVRGILEEMGVKEPGLATFILFGMMNWMYTWYDQSRDGGADKIAAAVKRIFSHGVA